jgi:apolipoprotein N-acyltransferase
VIVALNILLWKGAVSRRLRPLLVAGAVFAAVCFYGVVRMQTITLKRSLHVGLVQASVPQEMKQALESDTYDPLGVLTRYLDATIKMPRDRKIDLLVWPETVVLSPYTLNVDPSILRETAAKRRASHRSRSPGWRKRMAHTFLSAPRAFLPAEYGYVSDPQIALKIPEGNWDAGTTARTCWTRTADISIVYDKIHLVPFGEYIPLRTIFPFLVAFVPFDASLNAGERQTIFRMTSAVKRPNSGVLICYEDTDSELARRLRRDGADFLVNISNDAWFGLSELDQHFVTARFRAVENRTGVIRSGNNGLSGLIDPLGRAEIVLDKDEIRSGTGDLWVSDANSIYTQVGDLPEVAVSGMILWWNLPEERSDPTNAIMSAFYE